MEISVKLCLACKDACSELIMASKNGSTNLNALCKKCSDACVACADECAKHTDMHHCKVCADACNKCAIACKNMLKVAAWHCFLYHVY